MSVNRIVLVTNALDGGGAERSMRLIHQEMRKRGIDVYLIALNASTTTEVQSANSEIELSREWKSGVGKTISNLRDFQKIIQRLKPNTVILNCELPELFGALSNLHGAQTFTVEHTSNPWFGRRKLGYVVRGVLVLKRTKWITVSSNQSKVWPFSRQARYIPNPVVLDGAKNKTRFKHQIVYLGRLRSEKRPVWVLAAAEKIGLGVDVIGDGELRESLEKAYPNDTTFHGYSSSPWANISESQVIVVPSEFEGDGLVVAEAILYGQAILLVDIPDLRRFELSENCYFKNEAELEEKLSFIKAHGVENFRPSVQIQDRLREARSLSGVCNEWLEVTSAK